MASANPRIIHGYSKSVNDEAIHGVAKSMAGVEIIRQIIDELNDSSFIDSIILFAINKIIIWHSNFSFSITAGERQLIWRNIGSEPRLRLRSTREGSDPKRTTGCSPTGPRGLGVTCPYHVLVCKDAPLVDLRQCPSCATPRSVHQSPTSTTPWKCIGGWDVCLTGKF